MERGRSTTKRANAKRRSQPPLFWSDQEWRLDDKTRAIGLAGVARARLVLAEAVARAAQDQQRAAA